METIVFAGISLILLIPIVYVLPLSLTFKGKLVIIGGAVAVALAGLVFANIFPLWQAILFLALLLFLALFLIDKKIEPLMLSTQTEADFYEAFGEKPTLSESKSRRVSLTKMEESNGETIVYETSEHHIAASEENTMEMEEPKNSVDNEIIIIDAEMEIRTRTLDESESLPETETPVKSEISEMEELLEEDYFVETVMDETETLPEIEIPVKSGISEMEELLEEDFAEPMMDKMESLPEIEIPVKSEISEMEEDFVKPMMDEAEILSEYEIPVKSGISEIEELLEEDFVEPMMDEIVSPPDIEVPVKSDLSEIEKLLEADNLELEIEEVETQPNSQLGSLEETDNSVHLEGVEERITPLEIEELEVFPEEHDWEVNITELEKDTIDSFQETEEPVIPEDLSDETGREDSLEIIMEEQYPDNIQLEGSIEKDSLLEIPEQLPEKSSTHLPEPLENGAAIDEPEHLLEESSAIIEQSKEIYPESSSSDVEQIQTIPEEMTTATEHGSELQQQMFQTMVSHIQIAQHQMNETEFEQLVMSHLHPNIPDQQYYIFASFLIQSYMTAKKTEKLRELIAQLKEKLSAHPILLQELEFMERRFC
ncbi:hypothetical protein ACQKL5_00865 [Peribacillus sp. NPDC097675]|uniref:hypothetical protein n=1 Tax=Peribacillus sp. NPDC097675 TaxID=3390618 RepID=UPI003D06304F